MAEPPRLRSGRVAGEVHRIVSSRFPPVGIWDTAGTPEAVALLAELEGLTNERLRNDLGQIQLVAPEDRLSGPGTTPIMAAFCHPNREGSRFSDGSYGVYYAGRSAQTAVLETAFHRGRMLRAAGIAREVLEMRRYVTRLRKPLTELPTRNRRRLLDPEDYQPAQAFGRALRRRGAWGIHYPSVRDPDGQCVAVLRPPALHPVVQASHYRYHFDGTRIAMIEQIDQAFQLQG